MKCIFCDIVSDRVSSYRIWENDTHLAFLSIYPNTLGVTVVIPKKHYSSYIVDIDDDATVELMKSVKTVAKIIDEKSFENWIGKDLIFFGNGAEKCNTILNKENHIFYDQNCCEASGQVELASDLFSNKIFNTLAHLEPFYLKEFQTNTKEK
jgi:hypothetical protein